MSKYFICCEQCFEFMAKRNTKAAKFWMDLCTIQMNQDSSRIEMENKELPEIRFLEILGYVISTDVSNAILVKVQGYLQNAGQHCFCIKGGRHD